MKAPLGAFPTSGVTTNTKLQALKHSRKALQTIISKYKAISTNLKGIKMRYKLTIDVDKLGKQPILEIVNLLQNQAEKLLRWHDATEWDDTLLNVEHKAVGRATLTPSTPELHPTIQQILSDFLKPPPTTGYYSRQFDGANRHAVQSELAPDQAIGN